MSWNNNLVVDRNRLHSEHSIVWGQWQAIGRNNTGRWTKTGKLDELKSLSGKKAFHSEAHRPHAPLLWYIDRVGGSGGGGGLYDTLAFLSSSSRSRGLAIASWESFHVHHWLDPLVNRMAHMTENIAFS